MPFTQRCIKVFFPFDPDFFDNLFRPIDKINKLDHPNGQIIETIIRNLLDFLVGPLRAEGDVQIFHGNMLLIANERPADGDKNRNKKSKNGIR